MTTIVLDPDALTCTMQALIRLWRNDPGRARRYLALMSPAELAEARMNAQRLVLLIQSLTPEGVAMAILQPDSLPDGVDGFSIAGRVS